MNDKRVSTTFFLVLVPSKVYGPDDNPRIEDISVRAVKKRPSLKANEIAVAVNIDVCQAVFVKPLIEASMSIDEEHIHRPNIETKLVAADKAEGGAA